MAKSASLGYIPRETIIHSLNGTTKLVMAVLVSVAVMITYDTRFLALMVFVSAIVFAFSKIRLREIGFVLIFISLVMLLNNIFIFIFAPEQGVLIYKSRHVICHLFGKYYLTQEQLFYMLNVTIKYIAVLPMALLFILTTDPSEFASSLNKIGVSYKIGYSVAIALRYIPDIQRDFHNISQAQQARGIDMSKNTGFIQRIKNISVILFPLVLSSLSRIDVISNAMELRGFGKHKKRTWYSERRFRGRDLIVILISLSVLGVSVFLNYKNGGRFYNPFITP